MSQFTFLFMTKKNIFVYKLFLSLSISELKKAELVLDIDKLKNCIP